MCTYNILTRHQCVMWPRHACVMSALRWLYPLYPPPQRCGTGGPSTSGPRGSWQRRGGARTRPGTSAERWAAWQHDGMLILTCTILYMMVVTCTILYMVVCDCRWSTWGRSWAPWPGPGTRRGRGRGSSTPGSLRRTYRWGTGRYKVCRNYGKWLFHRTASFSNILLLKVYLVKSFLMIFTITVCVLEAPHNPAPEHKKIESKK